ncbi:ABC transporter ATP-binding protein [Metabacillus litoralis]|uniref:ABC transporter ATP-binding protein n=1 Tax=Metabacillus litoralis TaxID=152268 RepID=UPI00203F2317|nr:ABC transporter ATP-binding protein [Metabacillus litoralis]MCM3650401.1 ABC transporter ATP-binding protein/permease [Metabacillus litoralis]
MILTKISSVIKEINIRGIQRAFQLLGPYIVKSWKFYAGLILILFVEIFLTIGFAWFFGTITDAAVQGQFEKLKSLIPIILALICISQFVTYFNTYLESYVTSKIKRDLKEHVLKHIMLLPTNKLSKIRSGDLLTHFTNDINCIDGVIGSNLIYLIQLPLISLAVFFYMLHINWQLSVLSLIIVPIAIIIGGVFGILIRNNSRTIYNKISDINSNLHETFQGLSVIRSFLLERMFAKKFTKQNDEYFNLEMKNARLRGSFYVAGGAISSIAYIISLCLGAFFVSNGTITVGSLLTFVTLMQHLINPLTGLAGLWGSFQSSASAVERISNVLDLQPEALDLPTYTKTSTLSKSIKFQNVNFHYEPETEIYKQLNLEIPTGQVIAFVGPSGAGKTTLFNLIQGFYQPQSGQILMDDVSISDLSPSVLRSSFASVAQETFLFGGTIKDNLLLARPNITELEMINAAIHANIHGFIMSLPDQYDTEIGERGVRLSGGQKQRLAIARAILKDAPILLLDEATSALDSESEFQVKEALDRLMKNKTTLVIAHRLSTIQHADLIIVMNEGEIVQRGTHQELMSQEGLYRKLTQTQFLINQNRDSHLSGISS